MSRHSIDTNYHLKIALYKEKLPQYVDHESNDTFDTDHFKFLDSSVDELNSIQVLKTGHIFNQTSKRSNSYK